MASKRIPSVHTVAGDDDLLTEILLRLPIRPLLRFKSVSKHWLSLITNPHFCRRRSRAPSGLFLLRRPNIMNPDYDFIPLEDTSPTKPPFGTLTFFVDRHRIRILQSCNGLLCCCARTSVGFNADLTYYIYNPTTHQFTTIPIPSDRGFRNSRVYTVLLAFDPSKSPHYKAVCVFYSQRLPFHMKLPFQYSIEVYSSQTGLWSSSGDPFIADVIFDLGVFWKGAINWVSRGADSLYFDVDEERLGKMPMPPLPDGREERVLRYFGESGDHLHLIQRYGPRTTQFSVYEMDKDYSGWSVKYLVDLDPVVDAFPESMLGLHYYKFLILNLFRRNDDNESFLVLGIPGKAIRYNFRDKTFKMLCDFAPGLPNFESAHAPMSGSYDAFQYIECLSLFV